MAEKVETQPGGLKEGVREGIDEMRENVSRDNIEGKLDDAVSDRPLVKHLLDLRNVLKGLAVAAVLTLIVSLLLSPKLGAIVLVIAFGIAWVAFSASEYNKRRPTKPADDDDE